MQPTSASSAIRSARTFLFMYDFSACLRRCALPSLAAAKQGESQNYPAKIYISLAFVRTGTVSCIVLLDPVHEGGCRLAGSDCRNMFLFPFPPSHNRRNHCSHLIRFDTEDAAVEQLQRLKSVKKKKNNLFRRPGASECIIHCCRDAYQCIIIVVSRCILVHQFKCY